MQVQINRKYAEYCWFWTVPFPATSEQEARRRGKRSLETQPYSAAESNRTRRQSPTVLGVRMRTVLSRWRIRTEPYSAASRNRTRRQMVLLLFRRPPGEVVGNSTVLGERGRWKIEPYCPTVLGVLLITDATVLSFTNRVHT